MYSKNVLGAGVAAVAAGAPAEKKAPQRLAYKGLGSLAHIPGFYLAAAAPPMGHYTRRIQSDENTALKLCLQQATQNV